MDTAFMEVWDVDRPREARILGRLHGLEDERGDWMAAGWSLGSLRRKGITVPLSDALIATLAERRALDVLTLDAHFDHFEIRRLPIGD